MNIQLYRRYSSSFDVNRGVQLRPNGEAWEKQENKASCSFFGIHLFLLNFMTRQIYLRGKKKILMF